MQEEFNKTYDPMLDDDESESQTGVWIKRIVLIAVGLAILGGIGYGIMSLMSGGAPAKKKVTTIKLIPDTPPPPPPPPPKEPPKEQPKPDAPKEIKVEQPKPVETPPAEQLKMEGAAGDGPSAFASGQVNNDYKGGDIKTGNTIGGGPNKYQFAWYTDLLKNQIEDAMSKDKTLASGAYKVVVKVWVASNGAIERFELASSSGKPDIDALIKKQLNAMPKLAERPPGDMPQPVKLRVTARSVG
ncbi:MAG: TonB-dependent receptor [Methylotenera sp.]|nr:MAG: TonB-dependent receptor [Methylotenera sp.]